MKKGIPCPCGSGKVYEDCCGKISNVVSLTQVRLRKVGQNLRRLLGDYVGRFEYSKDAARAQELYFRHLDVSINDFDDDFLMERCFEWFIFDFRLPDGERIIDKFKGSTSLTGDEKSLLTDWSRAANSLYEVKAVFPGQLFLEDILMHNRVVVSDVNAVREISPGFILYMRVLPVGEENEFSTSGLALPGSCKNILLKKLFADACRFWDSHNYHEDWNLYLRERSHVVNSIIMQITVDSGMDLPEEGNAEAQLENLLQAIDIDENCASPEDFPWREVRYRRVAQEVAEELYSFRYNYRQVSNALRLWYDYSSLERPSFRKPEAWVAAIIYALSRLERDYRENQSSLAERYGISPSTISGKYRSICKILGLKDFDERYSTCGKSDKLCRVGNNVSFLSHYLSKRK